MAGAICGESCSESSSSGSSWKSPSGTSSSGSSNSSSSGSTSSSGGNGDGGTVAAAYVEFFLDSGKYQSGTGYYVQSIEAEGQSYTPEPLGKGTGSCTDKNVFHGTPATNPYDLAVAYTMYVRNYGSLDAAMQGLPYKNEEYKGAFRINELKPGCNTFVVVDTSHGPSLARQ